MRKVKISQLQPLYNWLIVKRDDKPKESAGGIILDGAHTEEVHAGTIVAIGSGAFDEHGKRVPMEVKLGDYVVLVRHAFQRANLLKITDDDGEYCRIRQDEIVTIVKGDENG